MEYSLNVKTFNIAYELERIGVGIPCHVLEIGGEHRATRRDATSSAGKLCP